MLYIDSKRITQLSITKNIKFTGGFIKSAAVITSNIYSIQLFTRSPVQCISQCPILRLLYLNIIVTNAVITADKAHLFLTLKTIS